MVILVGLRERGLKVPRLVIADGRLGLWAALAEVSPEFAEQRCWNHELVNVLVRLPRRVQAERIFRRLDHPELLPEVAMGARYSNGIRVLEDDTGTTDQEDAA